MANLRDLYEVIVRAESLGFAGLNTPQIIKIYENSGKCDGKANKNTMYQWINRLKKYGYIIVSDNGIYSTTRKGVAWFDSDSVVNKIIETYHEKRGQRDIGESPAQTERS